MRCLSGDLARKISQLRTRDREEEAKPGGAGARTKRSRGWCQWRDSQRMPPKNKKWFAICVASSSDSPVVGLNGGQLNICRSIPLWSGHYVLGFGKGKWIRSPRTSDYPTILARHATAA
jgi:hypothetical protein